VCVCVCVPLACCLGLCCSVRRLSRLSGDVKSSASGRISNGATTEFGEETGPAADNCSNTVCKYACSLWCVAVVGRRADLVALSVVARILKNCSYLKKQMCATAVTMPPWLTFRRNLCAHSVRVPSSFCAALRPFQNSENLRQQASTLKRRLSSRCRAEQSPLWRKADGGASRGSPQCSSLFLEFCGLVLWLLSLSSVLSSACAAEPSQGQRSHSGGKAHVRGFLETDLSCASHAALPRCHSQDTEEIRGTP
jgi:hypothetical protein